MSKAIWENIKNKADTKASYNIFHVDGPEREDTDALQLIKQIFPTGEADWMNFVLFSTSGVHGSRRTIEDAEKDLEEKIQSGEPIENYPQITFLIVRPRTVCLQYGNCQIKNKEDVDYLKKLRASSWAVTAEIGKHEGKESQ